jgi:hypothetical protein
MKERRERKNTKQNLGGRVAVALTAIIASLAFTSTPSFAQASGAATKTKESLQNLGSDSIVGTSSSTEFEAQDSSHAAFVATFAKAPRLEDKSAKSCPRESDCGQYGKRRVVLSSVREEPNAIEYYQLRREQQEKLSVQNSQKIIKEKSSSTAFGIAIAVGLTVVTAGVALGFNLKSCSTPLCILD